MGPPMSYIDALQITQPIISISVGQANSSFFAGGTEGLNSETFLEGMEDLFEDYQPVENPSPAPFIGMAVIHDGIRTTPIIQGQGDSAEEDVLFGFELSGFVEVSSDDTVAVAPENASTPTTATGTREALLAVDPEVSNQVPVEEVSLIIESTPTKEAAVIGLAFLDGGEIPTKEHCTGGEDHHHANKPTPDQGKGCGGMY